MGWGKKKSLADFNPYYQDHSGLITEEQVQG
jgi:hypothetical protein